MIWYAANNQTEPARGNSGESSICVPTLAGFFIGDKTMYIHGETNTRLHNIWMHMRGRCQKKNNVDYENYGMRGISFCREWEEYIVFRDWALEHGYCEDLTIDRIDNDGNYCPENCRWVNRQVQCNNKRGNKLLEIAGKKRTLRQWCNIFSANYVAVKERIKNGWKLTDALRTPKQKPWARKRLGMI